MNGSAWNRNEQIIVLYYYLIKGARGYTSDHLVQELAGLIPGHSAASIAMKIGNYTYLNTNKKGGLKHISKLDKEIWEQFSQDIENLESASGKLLSKTNYRSGEKNERSNKEK